MMIGKSKKVQLKKIKYAGRFWQREKMYKRDGSQYTFSWVV